VNDPFVITECKIVGKSMFFAIQRIMVSWYRSSILLSLCIPARAALLSGDLFLPSLALAQNHIYTVYIRYFLQGNHQIYGHIRCIYTVLANPNHLTPCFVV
jgi:hypothetical protein